MERLTLKEQGRLIALLQARDRRRAWVLKEEFRAWYRRATGEDAAAGLARWAEAVRREGPPEFRSLLTTFRRWGQEGLNSFRWRSTNGYTEGLNNRIKAIKRRGYGYRSRDTLRHLVLYRQGDRERQAARGQPAGLSPSLQESLPESPRGEGLSLGRPSGEPEGVQLQGDRTETDQGPGA